MTAEEILTGLPELVVSDTQVADARELHGDEIPYFFTSLLDGLNDGNVSCISSRSKIFTHVDPKESKLIDYVDICHTISWKITFIFD